MERNAEYWQFDFHCNADSAARQAKGTWTSRGSAMPAEHRLEEFGEVQKQPIDDGFHSGTGVFLNCVPKKPEVQYHAATVFDGAVLFGC